jgi:hypothetical protein
VFQLGSEYSYSALTAFVGSRQNSVGVIWGPREPGSIIVTSGGEKGKEFGYEDVRHPDGTWSYFGQGAKGDHNEKKPANRMLIDGNKTVLLFKARKPKGKEAKEFGSRKLYKYEGSFACASFDWVVPGEGTRAGNRVLVFELVPVPVGSPEMEVKPIGKIDELSLEALS